MLAPETVAPCKIYKARTRLPPVSLCRPGSSTAAAIHVSTIRRMPYLLDLALRHLAEFLCSHVRDSCTGQEPQGKDHTVALSRPLYNISPINLIPSLLCAIWYAAALCCDSHRRCFCVYVFCTWGVCYHRHTRQSTRVVFFFFCKSSRSASQPQKK